VIGRLLHRCTPSLAVACVALFVALAGTAAAALAITGADVVDGSLTGADLAARTVGPRELLDVGGAFQERRTFESVGQDVESVAAIGVPAGTYLITANAALIGSTQDDMVANCSVEGPEGRVARASVSLLAKRPGNEDQVALARVASTAGGRFELRCNRFLAGVDLGLSDISLSAVRITGLRR
jgi:hypothetical protein